MATAIPRPADPATDRRLARLHLRMGQLALARAELEALAGGGHLDDDGLLALAEARWRTGDLTGAGEAARAYLETGGDALVALVIAAESVAAAGRPGEARRIAGRALDQSDAPLDRIFAGMPRSAIWPVDPADASAGPATLFGGEPAPASRPAAAPPAGEPEAPAAAAGGPGFWDADDAGAGELPDGFDALERAGIELAAGRLREAAIALSLVVRLAPELAPRVLQATERRAHRSPEIELVRGDALRLVGHELDARRAYVAAAAALGRDGDPAGAIAPPPATARSTEPAPQEDS